MATLRRNNNILTTIFSDVSHKVTLYHKVDRKQSATWIRRKSQASGTRYIHYQIIISCLPLIGGRGFSPSYGYPPPPNKLLFPLLIVEQKQKKVTKCSVWILPLKLTLIAWYYLTVLMYFTGIRKMLGNISIFYKILALSSCKLFWVWERDC